MSALRLDSVAGSPEERIENLLRYFSKKRRGDAIDVARWALRNWLKSRRALTALSKATLSREMAEVVREGLEVDDE